MPDACGHEILVWENMGGKGRVKGGKEKGGKRG